MDATAEEMLTDFYGWYFAENPNGEEFTDDDFDEEIEAFMAEVARGRVTP